MIRYGELSLKGKNRRTFIRRLCKNIDSVLSEYTKIKIKADNDRAYVHLNGHDGDEVMEHLKLIFGIKSFSPIVQVSQDYDEILAAAKQLVESEYDGTQTFKVDANRADKNFPMTSPEVNRELGADIIRAFPDIKAEMREPDIRVSVDIRREGVNISTQRIEGLGGFPVGTGGKAMLMLSGGIDSPVAGYLTMKKGIEVDAVHFFSPPYTSPQALLKAKDLTARISRYSGTINFIQVPFTEIQEEIKQKLPDSYSMTANRRFMLEITDRLRAKRGSLAIVNGESIGQVASQTLESMFAINAVTSTPILRPLVSMDKSEIMDIARDIDTYELSIQPYEDACTVFAPERPKTMPKLEKIQEFEKVLDWEGLIERAIAGIEITPLTPASESGYQSQFDFEDLL